MTIHVRTDQKAHKFDMLEGWHVTRDGDGLDVRYYTKNGNGIKTDKCHIFASGVWKELWIE